MIISKEQFISLLEEHTNILYKISRSYCHDPDDRKDLEQEIVIQIWKSLKNFNPEFRLSTWIYRIGLNVAISHLRKDSKRRNQFEPLEEAIFEVSDDEEENEVVTEQLATLNHFINQLDSLNKALMILYLDGKSYKEMSEIMGISESNVSTKISRIKKEFRQKFNHQTHTESWN